MDDFYLLNVDFIENDKNKYKDDIISELKTQLGHLFVRENDITLKLLFSQKTHTPFSFNHWFHNINKQKIGALLRLTILENNNDERLLKADLSESKLLKVSSHYGNYNENSHTIVLGFDSIKLYWKPHYEKTFSGEYYLNNAGFRLVNSFYTPLQPNSLGKNDGKFKINRKDNEIQYYKIEESSFHPEFNFVHKDGFESNKAFIHKEPRIQFEFDEKIDEKKAIYYGNVFIMLASFYYHVKIDYLFQRIYLPENIVTIHKVEEENIFDTRATLLGLGNHWDFDQFLQANWQNKTLENYELLSRAITLFNHSHTVDTGSVSRFHLLYNVIEVLNKQKKEVKKYKQILSKKELKIKFKNVLKILLETIDKTEHEDFKRRWETKKNNLITKSMRSQLEIFLQSQKIDLGSSSITIKDINKMRNRIVHGDTSGIDYDLLRKINHLLYRISGILILNFMGISEWHLDTEIN